MLLFSLQEDLSTHTDINPKIYTDAFVFSVMSIILITKTLVHFLLGKRCIFVLVWLCMYSGFIMKAPLLKGMYKHLAFGNWGWFFEIWIGTPWALFTQINFALWIKIYGYSIPPPRNHENMRQFDSSRQVKEAYTYCLLMGGVVLVYMSRYEVVSRRLYP